MFAIPKGASPIFKLSRGAKMKPSFFGLNRDGAIRMTTCEVPWNWGAWHQHSNKLFKTGSAKETYMLRTMRHLRANKPLEWERRPARNLS